MSDKIKVTNSDYPFAIPNGTVMRVVSHAPGGVFAESDDAPGQWTMLTGTYEYLSGIKLEVGKTYELNNGEVHECERMRGDDPLAVNEYGHGPFAIDGCAYHQGGRYANRDADHDFSVKRCVPVEPKKWSDMTPEEKGELLLAHHEGRGIEIYIVDEWFDVDPIWYPGSSYRIKPDPTITPQAITTLDGHTITYNLIDGEPDPASVRMVVAP